MENWLQPKSGHGKIGHEKLFCGNIVDLARVQGGENHPIQHDEVTL